MYVRTLDGKRFSVQMFQAELCGEGKSLKGGHVAQLFRFLCEELGYDPRSTADATTANRTMLNQTLVDQSRVVDPTQISSGDATGKGQDDDSNLFSASFLAGLLPLLPRDLYL